MCNADDGSPPQAFAWSKNSAVGLHRLAPGSRPECTYFPIAAVGYAGWAALGWQPVDRGGMCLPEGASEENDRRFAEFKLTVRGRPVPVRISRARIHEEHTWSQGRHPSGRWRKMV